MKRKVPVKKRKVPVKMPDESVEKPLIAVRNRIWMQQDNLDSVEGASDIDASQFRDNAKWGNLRMVDRGKGNLVSSLVAPGQHLPILDLDLPHQYVPSSTPGHGHLYLNYQTLADSEYFTMMVMLHEYGVVGRGSVEQLKAYSASTVRAPGTSKRAYYNETNYDEEII